jgi:hypothetical protein
VEAHVRLFAIQILIGVALAAHAAAARAADEDKYGTVRVAESRDVWTADGKEVRQVQFTPDGARIVFLASGKDELLIGSIKPDGSATSVLWKTSEPGTGDARITIRGSRLTAELGGRRLEGGVDAELQETKPGPTNAPAPASGPYKLTALSPGGTFYAATRDVPSPVGIIRGAGLWTWKADGAAGGAIETKELLSSNEWLVGVAYYEHLIGFAPVEAGAAETKAIRFVGARIKPFPGMDHRPLCVWEVPVAGGEPKRLGTFGWWPRFLRGDPGLRGVIGWNVGIDGGTYISTFDTGRVYKLSGADVPRVEPAFSPDGTMLALPGKSLRVLKLEKKD